MLVTFVILTLLTMAIDAVGFKRFIWFISIGYGYSVAGIALAVAIIHFHSLTWATGLLLLELLWKHGLIIKRMWLSKSILTVLWIQVCIALCVARII